MAKSTNDASHNESSRPTFIDVGPGRCATSWLHQSLAAHPEIEMASVKETEYFNTFSSRSTHWYESHFPMEAPAIGEISSNYYLDSQVPDRIRNYDSSVRIIINLRNPYSLIQSFYNFGIRRGLQLDTLSTSLDMPIGSIMGSGYSKRKKSGDLTTSDSVSLLDSVCLYDRLKPFTDAFPKEQVHFFVFEELQHDWQEALSKLYSFLGVDSSFSPADAGRIVNSSVAPKSVLLARLATNTASFLRKMGMYRILSKLHQSEAIKRILFRENNTESQLSTVRNSLNDSVVAKLDQQIELLKQFHPPLNQFWAETKSLSGCKNEN